MSSKTSLKSKIKTQDLIPDQRPLMNYVINFTKSLKVKGKEKEVIGSILL